MTYTNAQAALLAATTQIDPSKGPFVIPAPDGSAGTVQVSFDAATRRLAAGYLTWLDQQDELSARLPEDSARA